MFQSFVITLREGIEAALIIGIVLGHLRKTGRESWSRIVYWALAISIAASLAGAFVLSRIEVNQEALEGWLNGAPRSPAGVLREARAVTPDQAAEAARRWAPAGTYLLTVKGKGPR